MVFEEKCGQCGYKEKKIIDGSVPLRLDFMDGDESNQHLYNATFVPQLRLHRKR